MIGIYDQNGLMQEIVFSLYAPQHRGKRRNSCYDNSISYHKGMGLVADALMIGPSELEGGKAAIGHVRYTTSSDGM